MKTKTPNLIYHTIQRSLIESYIEISCFRYTSHCLQADKFNMLWRYKCIECIVRLHKTKQPAIVCFCSFIITLVLFQSFLFSHFHFNFRFYICNYCIQFVFGFCKVFTICSWTTKKCWDCILCVNNLYEWHNLIIHSNRINLKSH